MTSSQPTLISLRPISTFLSPLQRTLINLRPLSVSIGLGPDEDSPPPSGPRIIVDEFGIPLPIISDHEPYRTSRLSAADASADEWYASILDGPSFLGPVSSLAKERILAPVPLLDAPVFEYGEEEWTPYVSRRLPTSPLFPAYGLEMFGLPVLRRNAEAWRHFDVAGLLEVDYSGESVGIGSNMELSIEQSEDIVSSLRTKGAWLEDNSCAGRLVYINGRFCPNLSKQTDHIKNLDSTHFDGTNQLSEQIVEYLFRLPDGFTDELAAQVPDQSKGPLTSFKKLSGPDHCLGEPTSQWAINHQQGTAAFAALNSVKSGCIGYVEAEQGRMESKPVLIINAQTPSGGGAPNTAKETGVAFHPRLLAVARNESVLSLIQMCVDLDDTAEEPCATFVNGYTQIFVGANANVTHSYLEETGGVVTPLVEMTTDEFDTSNPSGNESPRDIESKRPGLRNTHFESIDVHITGDSGSFSSSLMELGGCGHSLISISSTLLRPESSTSIQGFSLSGGAQRTEMRTNIHHVAQGTVSRQGQRNMVGGRSVASFRGRIRVEQSAQQTDSEQLTRTILLSDHARIWATPSLEIVADDVKCTHGATVSDLSEEELFYLRSRGIDLTTARNILMYAFSEEIGASVDQAIVGGFDDETGLRSRIIKRLQALVPEGEKVLVGGEFQSV